MFINLALGRLRQKKCRFRASLDYLDFKAILGH